MGIPHFFAWLLKNYKKDGFVFTKNKLSESIDYFLIDANCMIHPVCFRVLAENPDVTDNDKLENKMINAVIEYFEKIITYVDPSKGVYIAIDGVAPVAKVKQQRLRRFKSVADKNLWDNIKRKHNVPIHNHWNNNAVTPGTEFMEKLHHKIMGWAAEYKNGIMIGKQIIYSSSFTPSEGEHKLLQFIRTNQKNGITDLSYVIYGLDADLIFLALTTGLDSIYLLRESNEISKNGSKEVLNYVSMKIMKESIVNTIKHYCIKGDMGIKESSVNIIDVKKLDGKNIIDDFIFMCYFLGNDFLPHIPSLDIQHNGIESLIVKYTETIGEILLETNKIEYLMENASDFVGFNQNFLYRFLNKLSQMEETVLRENYASGKRRMMNDGNEFEKEMHRIENLQFKIVDPIQLGSDNPEKWRFRYYNHYWGVTMDELEEFSEKLVEHYMLGLKWVSSYYFKDCPSWSWYFPYDHPPFISDIAKYFLKPSSLQLNLDKPIKPFVQLLAVLPPQSNFLLPTNLRKLMINPKSSLIFAYPTEFEQDFLNKTKHWKGIPNLPPLDMELLKHCYSKYENEVSSGEMKRNKMEEVFYF
jgi:5'-3' exonuclease